MLAAAIAEARKGLAEGGIPIGAAIFDEHGTVVGYGHNRRVQNGDPSLHGETDAFRNAGRQRSYKKLTMVTTLAPCWYCSGLVRQFNFARVIVGESRNFQGGIEWLRSLGIEVIDFDSQECVTLLSDYIKKKSRHLARRHRRRLGTPSLLVIPRAPRAGGIYFPSSDAHTLSAIPL